MAEKQTCLPAKSPTLIVIDRLEPRAVSARAHAKKTGLASCSSYVVLRAGSFTYTYTVTHPTNLSHKLKIESVTVTANNFAGAWLPLCATPRGAGFLG